MLSHDWPRGVTDHGDVARLLRYKKHFADDTSQDRLGSPPDRHNTDRTRPSSLSSDWGPVLTTQ